MMHRYPVPPSANRYWRHYWGGLSPVMKPSGTNKQVAMRAMLARPLSGPVAVEVAVYRAPGRGSGQLSQGSL